MFGFSVLAASLAGTLLTQQAPTTDFVAEPLPIGTPCEQDDLVGVWKNDLLGRSVDGRTAPPVLGTDYMRFGADGAMVYFASAQPLTQLSEVEHGLDVVDQAPSLNFKASIVRTGILIITRDGVPVEGFTCSVIRNTNEAGELIWSQLRGRPPVFRHSVRLRR